MAKQPTQMVRDSGRVIWPAWRTQIDFDGMQLPRYSTTGSTGGKPHGSPVLQLQTFVTGEPMLTAIYPIVATLHRWEQVIDDCFTVQPRERGRPAKSVTRV